LRYLDEDSVRSIARGAAVLGSGGGGDPYVAMLQAIYAIQKNGPVALVSVDELTDVNRVVSLAGIGASTIGSELIPAASQDVDCFQEAVNQIGENPQAIMAVETGGGNSLIPIACAAKLHLPVVDADSMGRAFPETTMTTFNVFNYRPTPMVLADGFKNVTTIKPTNHSNGEKLARKIAVAMGGRALIAMNMYKGKQIKKAAVRGTISTAERIGNLLSSQSWLQNPLDELVNILSAKELFVGKVQNVRRDTQNAVTQGDATLIGLEGYAGKTFNLKFQNESLIGLKDHLPVITTPDIITCLNLDDNLPYTVNDLHYGNRIRVIGIPAPKIWRRTRGIELVGPKINGYSFEYQPFERLVGEI
jgi:DUF917 family protein